MRLSAETHHLLQKRLQQALQPRDIIGCAVLATVNYAVAYLCLCFDMRYHNEIQAHLFIACLGAISAFVVWLAYHKHRTGRPCRTWIAMSIGMWFGLSAGYVTGDRYWYSHTLSYYSYQEMASYVNIDPEVDGGKGFMDVGSVYFKEGSHVLRSKALAFHNGATYCIAPIIRKPIDNADNSYRLPESGTVDFWAVGTDCCGTNGEDFACSDARSGLARSGLRMMDGTSRSMYLLAVQEWSASTRLPVKHPIFVHWVKDPVSSIQYMYDKAWVDYDTNVCLFAVVSGIGSFLLHMGIQKLRVF